jgi:hypothetical protein
MLVLQEDLSLLRWLRIQCNTQRAEKWNEDREVLNKRGRKKNIVENLYIIICYTLVLQFVFVIMKE